MKVAILGCGMSGLMAAWACHRRNVRFEIFADRSLFPKSYGFAFLHSNCDMPLKVCQLKQMIVPPEVEITEASKFYSLLVYGTEKLENSLTAAALHPDLTIWNIDEAAAFLFSQFAKQIQIKKLENLDGVIKFSESYDLIFSTIPLDVLDKQGNYSYVQSFLTVQPSNDVRNIVFYNGGISLADGVYRWGTLFGTYFEEGKKKTDISVKKVITAENLPSVPENVILCGRYGSWNKRVLLHDVYSLALEKLDG